MPRTLHYFMNTGAQTAVIPLYIKERNFFYLFYLTFGNIHLLNILMHTYTMRSFKGFKYSNVYESACNEEKNW